MYGYRIFEHAPFPKVVIRWRISRGHEPASLERTPFPKVIRSAVDGIRSPASLEHAPFPKVIRYVRTEKPL